MNEMRMNELEVQDYARQMFEAHGARAIAEAADKARTLDAQGQSVEAATWRRIEAAVKSMSGPRAS